MLFRHWLESVERLVLYYHTQDMLFNVVLLTFFKTTDKSSKYFERIQIESIVARKQKPSNFPDGRDERARRVRGRAVPLRAAGAVLRAGAGRAGGAGVPVAGAARAARARRRPAPPRRVGGHAAALRRARR